MSATPLRRWPLPTIIGAIVLLAVVVGVALTIAQPPGRQASVKPTTQATTQQPSAGPTSAAPASPSPPDAGLGDGIYTVGTEVQAGAYTTTVPAGRSYGCYWARLRSFGQDDSIIDEDNLDPGEHARVVVKPTDRGFKVSNGCTWHQAL